MSGNEAVFQHRGSRRFFAVETGMHRQRKRQVTNLDRIGGVVGHVNRPAEYAALRLEANGHTQCGAAIVLRLMRAWGVRGSRSLCRVEFLPWAAGTPPRDLNRTKLLAGCNVVRWEGVGGEAETRQRTAIELKKKRRSRMGRLR